MKIAFVTNTCWNVFNFREGLVKFFLNRGDEVISLAPIDDYTPEIEKWGVRHIETPLDQTGTNPLKDFGYMNKIRSVFNDEKPDVALCFTIKSNIYSSLAGKIAGVPIICNVSGLGTVFLVKGLFGKVAIGLYRLAFKYSSYVFFQNMDDKELFLTHVSLRDSQTGILPGSGINLIQFNFTNARIKSPTKFLMIARLIEEKGVREYAEAARVLFKNGDPVKFTLVGNWDEHHTRSIPKGELENWVSGGFIDYLPHSDVISQLVEDNEVIVLPSYREGTPRTLLEGAAKGRALLASNVPGCKEVVSNGVNGFLFDVKSAQSIVDKVRLYLSLSESEKLAMSKNSRKIAEEKFDENLVINTYVETIAQIVDK